MILSPLGQFKIASYNVAGISVITNFSLTAIALILLIIGFMALGQKSQTVKNVMGTRVKMTILTFIYSLVKTNLGVNKVNYFGVLLTLFLTVFAANLLGLIPYSFTLTSHIIVALSLSVPVFVAMTGEAIYRNGWAFFSLFLPAGAPVYLIPLLVIIEFISYNARVFSLAIRLTANLVAGHVILKIIAGTCVALFASPLTVVLSAAPISVLLVFYGLELAVAGLQAYVFTVLCCNYLADAFNLH